MKIFLLSCLVLLSCATKRTYSIFDVSKECKFILHHYDEAIHITSIELTINGNIDGNSTLTIIEAGKPYKIFNLKNNFNIKYQNDWYDDSIEFIYQANSTKNGNIVIEYNF